MWSWIFRIVGALLAFLAADVAAFAGHALRGPARTLIAVDAALAAVLLAVLLIVAAVLGRPGVKRS